MAQLLSPLPGTFYRRPAPDKPSYRQDGDAVAVGDVVGLIEVMSPCSQVTACGPDTPDGNATRAARMTRPDDVRSDVTPA